MSKDYMEDSSLSEKWKYRFSFYNHHGFPGFWRDGPVFKQAFTGLTLKQKITIRTNIIAFFFSWIYLFVLGLWKKAIIVLLLQILAVVIVVMSGYNILGFVVSLYVAHNTNRWFYEKKVKNIDTWSL